MTVFTPPQAADTEEAATRSRRVTGVATLVALTAAMVIAAVLWAWFHNEASQLEASVAANDALVDTAATAEVSAQISDAVRRAYSYDYARLDENERSVAQVITGPFVEDFRLRFSRIREMAPPQQAVVVATVLATGVENLDSDRATVLVFLDQEARQAGRDKPFISTARLYVAAQRVGGSWKIANVESR